MEKTYLIVNPGSASKKYAVYRGGTEAFFCHIEYEGDGIVARYRVFGAEKTPLSISSEDYQKSARFILSLLAKETIQTSEFQGIVFRIVAPGEYFSVTRAIDEEYLKNLRSVYEEAPLHITETLSEIDDFRSILSSILFLGISDSSFHSSLPDVSRFYGIDTHMKARGIRKYGYHGISLAYILSRIKEIKGKVPENIIVCHLGSGSSVTALKNGASIDTSMGFTPLEGLLMATRSGDIDAGAAIQIARDNNFSLDELETYLNTKSGLLGVGNSSDVRELLIREIAGDADASLALRMFVYRVKKYIGAYIAVLGGVDMLVFTGTIGERSFVMRSRICSELETLGIMLDAEKNALSILSHMFIHASSSKTEILAVQTNEVLQMAREAYAFLNQ